MGVCRALTEVVPIDQEYSNLLIRLIEVSLYIFYVFFYVFFIFFMSHLKKCSVSLKQKYTNY